MTSKELKRQKKELIKQIESAFENATKADENLSSSEKKEVYGTIIFYVDDTCKFEIINTKQALNAFKSAARKLPETMFENVNLFKVPSVKPGNKRIEGEGVKYYNPYESIKINSVVINRKDNHYYDEGFYSDGRYFISANKPTLKGLVIDETKNIKEYFIDNMDYDLESVNISGVLYNENLNFPVAHVKTSTGNFVYNVKYIDVIKTKFPESEMFFDKCHNLLIFKNEGKIVAGIINVQKDIKIDFENLTSPIDNEISNEANNVLETIETIESIENVNQSKLETIKTESKTCDSNEKGNIMRNAWAIRKAAALKIGCKVSEISMSVCMKQAWKEWKEGNI